MRRHDNALRRARGEARRGDGCTQEGALHPRYRECRGGVRPREEVSGSPQRDYRVCLLTLGYTYINQKDVKHK